MKWRIYYDDGSIVEDSEEDLKPYGVVCILQYVKHPGGVVTNITYGAPYYVFMDGEWVQMQCNDIEDRLAHRLPFGPFLVGRAVSKRIFTEVFDRAKADKDRLP